MAALVRGLLVCSAKSSFDKMSDELTLEAARVVQLDRVLAQYGPEAKEVRSALRRNFQATVDALVGPDESGGSQSPRVERRGRASPDCDPCARAPE